jgi:hypothetical protein
MIRKNSNWSEKQQVIKGDFAESIVDKFLEEKGYIIYNPKTSGAHAFDRIAIKDKKQMIIAESKAKARRKYYYDTGINYKHYKGYQAISKKHNLPVFLFFIDEYQGNIYGNFLERLSQEIIYTYNGKIKKYPCIENNIIYFCLTNMMNICDLTDKEVEFLKNNSTRNYSY